MPIEFNCKSGEIAGDSWSLMPNDSGSKHGGGRTKRTVYWIIALAVCLGLLLLSVILVGYNTRALGHWDRKYESLISDLSKGRETNSMDGEGLLKIHLNNLTREMERLQKETTTRDEPHQLMIHLKNLTKEIQRLQRESSVRSEPDQLMIHLKNFTKEMERLQRETTVRGEPHQLMSFLNNLTRELERLQRPTTVRDEGSQLVQLLNLTRELDQLQGQTTVRDERDLLSLQVNNLTEEMVLLQRELKAMTASRDAIQDEVNRLNINRTGSSCLPEWTRFNNRCYFVSPKGWKETWANSRKDCLSRGADLVIIRTRSEQAFVRNLEGISWIGLTDLNREGRWQWVDETYLEGEGFWQPGEPNDSGNNEDCVEISRDANAWNDAPCGRKFSWVCQY